MPDRRIYAGYYRRYDGKLIYVVTMAKDADTDEDIVVWTPPTYSERHSYYTMSKRSFCEDVLVDGAHQPKFKRQTQMKVLDSVKELYEEDGFLCPRKKPAHPDTEYDTWFRPSAATYYIFWFFGLPRSTINAPHSFAVISQHIAGLDMDFTAYV